MTHETNSNVTPLGVQFRQRLPEDRILVAPWEIGERQECNHLMATYIVCEGEAEVTCGRCRTKLDPMWVLRKLVSEDRRLQEGQKAASATDAKRRERQRTKCEHCDRMTRIKGI